MAQTQSILFLSEENLQPVAGVKILSLDQVELGQSDSLGVFLWTESQIDRVIVSHEQFLKQEITITGSRKVQTVILRPKGELLQQVDVTDQPIAESVNGHRRVQVANEEILQSGSQSFAEALSLIAGVQSVQTGVSISKPMIRGMTGSRVKVMDRGLSLEGQQWGMDHGLEVDPFRVSQVEIVKGPEAALYGSDALGGVVRIASPSTPAEGTTGDAQTLFRTNNMGYGFSAGLQTRKKSFFLLSRLSFQRYGDYRVPANSFTYNGFVLPLNDQRLVNTGGMEWAADITFGHQKDNGRSYWNISVYDQKAGLFPGAIGIPRYNQLDQAETGSDFGIPMQDTRHIKAAWHRSRQHKYGSSKLDFAWQWNDRKELSPSHSHGYVELDPNDSLALRMNLHTINGRFERNLSIGTNWKWTYGADAMVQWHEKAGFEYLIPNYRKQQAGGFVLGQWSRTWRWKYFASARVDVAGFQSDEHLQPWFLDPDSLVQRSPDINRLWINAVYSLGLEWQLNMEQAVSARIGKAFRLPSPAELAANGVHHGTFRHEVGQSDQDPEQGYQVDFGWTLDLTHFKAHVDVYSAYYSNFIYLSPSGRFSPLPDAGQLYIYEQDEAFLGGGEIGLTWKFLKNWTYQGSLEYTYAQNLSTRLPLPFIPPFQWRNQINWSYAGWLAGIDWQLVAAQERTDRNEPATPGYELLHLQVGKKIGPFQVHLRVNNLLDTEYLQHLSRYRILNLPEQGRNFVIRLRYDW